MRTSILALILTLVGSFTSRVHGSFVIYSYTGTTASGDSTIAAWFRFDTSAMADGRVFFYEIPQHSFFVSGSPTAMNGEYDRFLGGGIEFPSSAPGPQNLPSFQSLVIENSDTHYSMQSDHYGDPGIFICLDGPGALYSGVWSYGLVPEPSSAALFAIGCFLFLATGLHQGRLGRLVRRTSR